MSNILDNNSKFIEILNERSRTGENIVDVVCENNKVFQRQYTYFTLKNEKELMQFIEKLNLDDDFMMNKHNKEMIEFTHTKISGIKYVIWFGDLLVEREIVRDLGRLQYAESKLF